MDHIHIPNACDVLATLCSGIRSLGGEAEWDGDVITVQWPDGPSMRIQLEIDGKRVWTRPAVTCERCESRATWRVAGRGDLSTAELLCDDHWEPRYYEVMLEVGSAKADPISMIWRGTTL